MKLRSCPSPRRAADCSRGDQQSIRLGKHRQVSRVGLPLPGTGPDAFLRCIALLAAKIHAQYFRLAGFRPFCKLVVKNLDFCSQPRLPRVLQKQLVEPISLVFQFLPILILIILRL
jgi:hypothetical protein